MRFLMVLIFISATAAGAAAQTPCENDDALALQLIGNSIRADHTNATYNCCSSMAYSFEASEGQLLLIETEDLAQACHCECCFALAAVIADVPSGDWTVVLRWFDYEQSAWRELSAPITMPVGIAKSPSLGGQGKSQCGGDTVVGIGPESTSWGLLKTTYR